MEQPQLRKLSVNIDLKATKPVECEKCQGIAFQDAIVFRRVSALLTGTGKEGFYPIQVFCCTSCGHVNNEFLPEEIRTGLSLVTK